MRSVGGGRGLPDVRWSAVRRFRLERQQLLRRAPRPDLRSVLGRIGGVQAQLLSAAHLGVWNRVGDVTAEELAAGLDADRSLVKAWCMRRTLHLLPARDLALYVRGTALRAEKELRWVRNRGVPAAALERLVAATLKVLDTPRTRREIATEVAQRLKVPVRTYPGAGWGNRTPVPGVRFERLTFPVVYLLHLVGARGVICHGPQRGGEPTFVRADAWVNGFEDLPAEAAESELLRRYLGAFGPAEVDDFVLWTGLRKTDARRVWATLEPELALVNLEGRKAWVRSQDLADLEGASTQPGPVRLLPYFDPFLLGHRDRGCLMDPAYFERVYRPQGWIAPTVLVDGRVVGIWNSAKERSTMRVELEPFPASAAELRAPGVREALAAEAEGLAEFLGCAGAEVVVGRVGRSRAPAPVRRNSPARR